LHKQSALARTQRARLQSGGDVYANPSSGLMQAQTLKSQQLISTGMQINASGAAQIAIDGTVRMLGDRTTYTQDNLTSNGPDTWIGNWQASTDGMVLAIIGTPPSYQTGYAGMLTGTVKSGNTVTCTVFASTFSPSITVTSKKSGSQTVYLPIPGTFTMPVRNGESWSIVLTANSQFGAKPGVLLYWIPYGADSNATPPTLTTPAAPAAPAPLSRSKEAGNEEAKSEEVSNEEVSSEEVSSEALKLLPRATWVHTGPYTNPDTNPETDAHNENAVPAAATTVSADAADSEADTQVATTAPTLAADATAPSASDDLVQDNPAQDNPAQDNPAQDNPAQQLWAQLMALTELSSRHSGSGSGSGAVAASRNPLAPRAASSGNAQAEIDKRIADLTRVFGDATGMAQDPSQRAAFVAELQKIVCAPDASGIVQAKPLQDQDIQKLIDSFAAASGKTFTTEQRALLDAGVKSLVQINDNETSRNDLSLIKNNIGVFFDSIEQAVGITFEANAKRLLTRALTRLVGDGQQGGRLIAPASEATTTAAPASNAASAADGEGAAP
jgi:hypothetical protein